MVIQLNSVQALLDISDYFFCEINDEINKSGLSQKLIELLNQFIQYTIFIVNQKDLKHLQDLKKEIKKVVEGIAIRTLKIKYFKNDQVINNQLEEYKNEFYSLLKQFKKFLLSLI